MMIMAMGSSWLLRSISLLQRTGVCVATARVVWVKFLQFLKAECSMHSSPQCEVWLISMKHHLHSPFVGYFNLLWYWSKSTAVSCVWKILFCLHRKVVILTVEWALCVKLSKIHHHPAATRNPDLPNFVTPGWVLLLGEIAINIDIISGDDSQSELMGQLLHLRFVSTDNLIDSNGNALLLSDIDQFARNWKKELY